MHGIVSDDIRAMLFGSTFVKNFEYGKPKGDVFTQQQYPKLTDQKLREYNHYIHEMIADIKKKYFGNGMETPNLFQYLVHMHDCHECAKVVEPYQNLSRELMKNIPFFEGILLEIRESTTLQLLNGSTMTVSGRYFFDKFQQSGVPFVVQNFKIDTIKSKHGSYVDVISQVSPWISWEGSFPIFKFLAKIWKIENKRVTSVFRNSDLI